LDHHLAAVVSGYFFFGFLGLLFFMLTVFSFARDSIFFGYSPSPEPAKISNTWVVFWV
jgi:hypothetical protein